MKNRIWDFTVAILAVWLVAAPAVSSAAENEKSEKSAAERSREHQEKADRHDKAGDKHRSEGRHGQAMREYIERDKEIEKAADPDG